MGLRKKGNSSDSHNETDVISLSSRLGSGQLLETALYSLRMRNKIINEEEKELLQNARVFFGKVPLVR
jgi:hypothetical protein